MKFLKILTFTLILLSTNTSFATTNGDNTDIYYKQLEEDSSKDNNCFCECEPNYKYNYYTGKLGITGIYGVNAAFESSYQNHRIEGGGIYLNLYATNPQVPSWHFSAYGAHIRNYDSLHNHIAAVDTAIFWRFMPYPNFFLKSDLGVNMRYGTVLSFITAMLYLNLDFNMPNTGWHFNINSKNGLLLDVTTHDLLFTLGYEFNLPKFKPGIEIGYQLLTGYLIYWANYGILSHNAYASLYGKW